MLMLRRRPARGPPYRLPGIEGRDRCRLRGGALIRAMNDLAVFGTQGVSDRQKVVEPGVLANKAEADKHKRPEAARPPPRSDGHAVELVRSHPCFTSWQKEEILFSYPTQPIVA